MADGTGQPARPAATPNLTEDEFRRWYWTLAELRSLARTLGVSPSGRKAEVTERIAATLAGRSVPPTAPASTGDRIEEPLGGVTLAEAVEHWHRTLGAELPEQSESLEFNRFTKAWHRANPGGTAGESRQAWKRHRSLPRDQRPPV